MLWRLDSHIYDGPYLIHHFSTPYFHPMTTLYHLISAHFHHLTTMYSALLSTTLLVVLFLKPPGEITITALSSPKCLLYIDNTTM